MTEREMIERAQVYLYKLANGIDPITDIPVRDEDVINHVSVSRCLFFASDVLRKMLVNGGMESQPGCCKKQPFSITQEQLKRIQPSDDPVQISTLCQRITEAVANDQMTRLSPTAVLDWLESCGFLIKVPNMDGKMTRRPTSEGFRIGITQKERNGRRGEYIAVFYNEFAQRFILDNLDAVLNFKKRQ